MREKFHGVPMLPFGILAGFAEEREIRLTDLAEEGFRFRTAEKTEEPGKFRLCFYNSLAGGYREMELTDFEMEEEEHTSFFYIYVVYTEYMWFIQSQKLIEKRCAASSGSTAVTSV